MKEKRFCFLKKEASLSFIKKETELVDFVNRSHVIFVPCGTLMFVKFSIIWLSLFIYLGYCSVILEETIDGLLITLNKYVGEYVEPENKLNSISDSTGEKSKENKSAFLFFK